MDGRCTYMFSLRYGSESRLELDLPSGMEVFDHSAPRGQVLSDPAAAVALALADPINFPPLAQATVRGDRVVITLEQSLPQAARLLEGVLRTLLAGETHPEDITVLTDGSAAFAQGLLAGFSDDVRYAVRVLVHDPDDKSSRSYLAATSDGNPIYVHRALVDADVLVPIGVMRLASSLAYYGAAGSLFPAFSDRETQQRFHFCESDDLEAHQKQRAAEAREVAWLLGSLLTVQVIPGEDDTLLEVLAGDIRSIDEQGKKRCESAWQYALPKRAGIVVATIGGGPSQQTWEGFARALDASLAAVAENGAVVLCTSLALRPGPALRKLVSWSGDDVLPRRIRRDMTGDGLSASRIADAREHVHVYLISSMQQSHVEELGIAPVSSAHEIERLCRHYHTCVLLGSAQYAAVTIED